MGRRVYRALLHLYPSSFRAEYGSEIEAVFARRRREVGIPGAALLWLEAVVDVVWNAARAHWDILRQDFRYSARLLARSPGFAATAILVSALGVGATTATFSITDHVLVRPLPFEQPDRLVKLYQSVHEYTRTELSPGNYRDWKRMSRSFSSMGEYFPVSANLVGQGEPERIEGSKVGADLFPTLGVRPAVGRAFSAADDRAGAPGSLILSDRIWRGLFGGDPNVVGRHVILDDAPFVVIGVMPRAFHFPSRDTDFWIPFRFAEADYADRTDDFIYAVGRLAPGVSLEKSRSEMRLIASRLERAFPKENARTSASVFRLRDEVSGQSRVLLLALFGASLGVLLIACTNLANLLLARALARRREMAVRTALGAGRERLLRQLLTESLMLALVGGVVGVLLALAAAPLVARLVPGSLPIADIPPADMRVLGFAMFLTVATGIGFGVIPALRVVGGVDAGDFSDGGRGGAEPRTERLRALLVVAEVTASVALLIASGLLIRALWRLQSTDPGFRTAGVLTLRTALPMPKYEKNAPRSVFYDRVLTEVRRLPGVSSAGYVTALPMVMRGGIWPFTPEGAAEDPDAGRTASLRFVTSGYFATMGIPLRGRDVAETDAAGTPFVAVVSESFARRNWGHGDAIGRRFKLAGQDRTIVGVVGDIRVRGIERTSEPQVYLPANQQGENQIFYAPKDLVLQASSPASSLLPAIREIVRRADPLLPVSDVRSLADVVDLETAPRKVQLRILGGFAATALLLAGIGIHGLLAFTVSRRAREIGVRMALGAMSGDILRMVLRRGLLLAAFGVIPGAALAYAAGRAMESLLAGVHPSDPATFAAAIGLSFAMTVAGSLLPALRAVRVNPMSVIRTE